MHSLCDLLSDCWIPTGWQLENSVFLQKTCTRALIYSCNLFLGADWISGRIKRQVLDEAKVLSADPGHDCDALERGLTFFCAQNKNPDRLFVRNQSGFVWTSCPLIASTRQPRREENLTGCLSVIQAQVWGLLLWVLSLLHCSNLAGGSPQGLQTVWVLSTS